MTHARPQSILAVAVALVVALNAASVGLAVPASAAEPASLQTQAGQEEPAAGPGDADEAYVTEDGDVVLVYNENGSGSADGHIGANLSAGLFHLFLNDTVQDAGDTTGNLSLSLTGEQLTGQGDLLTTRPDGVEELSLSATGVTNDEESSSSVELEASVRNTDSSVAQPLDTTTQQETTFETSGSVTTSASQFSSEGSVTVSGSAGMTQQAVSASVTITEEGDDYVLDVARENRVSEFAAEQWSTEESARETIRAQFAPVAGTLGGQVSVDLASYSFDEETRQLDVEYTVTLVGVDQAVADRLAPILADADGFDLDEDEAAELADQLRSVEFTEVSASVDASGGSVAAEWDVQIDNYDELALASFEIADAVEQPAGMDAPAGTEAEFDSFEQNLEQSRAQFEAQRTSNLTRKATWDVSVSAGAERVDVSASVQQEAENWQAYVEAVENTENVSLGGDTEFDVQVETVDDEIRADGSFSLSQEGLIDQALQGAQQGSTQAGAGFGDQQPLQAFQRAEFEVAKMDVSAGEQTVTVEAGASFENATELRRFLGDTYGTPGEPEQFYAQPEEDGSVTYVRFANAVDEDPTASEVRALETVSEETTVYLPDEWDESETEFPEMDTEEVRSYLDLDETSQSGLGMETILPVAIGGAVLALAGGAVVGLRRL